MELKFNSEETNNCSTQDVYTQYKKWLNQNGVLVDPRVRYPTYFGQKGKGVVGVSASKPIQKNKVIIAVPYNLLITMDKVMGVQVLKKMINQNPDVFGVSEHAVMKMLILYVCFQVLKEKQSFYYPYFQVSKDSYLQKWTNWEIIALENKQLIKSLKRQKQEIQMFFLEFLRLFVKYENVFPKDKGNMFYQKIFQRAYSFVTTRAFGWSLPSISLIPMADSLNHGSNYLNHYLVDTQEQKKPSQTYVSYKDKSNLSIFKIQHLTPSQGQLNELRKTKKHRFQKFIIKHKAIIDSSKQLEEVTKGSKPQNYSERNKHYFILSEQYKSEVRNLRQLHFYQSSCSEDNDTDEEQLTDFTVKRERFQFDQKYKGGQKSKSTSKKSTVNKYWKLWTDNTLEGQQSQGDQEQTAKDQNTSEYIKQKKQTLSKFQEKHKESDGSSIVSSTQSEEDNQIFDWMQSPNSNNNKNCYFAMETKSIVRENQEMHNFYGRRTNRFLLQAYNFVMANNQYDSFGFRMFADPILNLKPNAQKLIYLGLKKQSTQKQISSSLTRQIRLKRQKLSIELINHCRCYTVQFQKKQVTNLSVTLPFDRQIQLRTLKLYKQIVQALYSQYMTDRQEDLQLLQKTVKHQLKTAISYRIMQKDILSSQTDLVQRCIDFLSKKWKNGRIEKPTWKDIKLVSRFRLYANSLQRGNVQ